MRVVAVCTLAFLAACGPQPEPSLWSAAPPLPQPVANNAVAGQVLDGRGEVYSFLGIDTTKTWSGVGSWAYRWRMGNEEWTPLPPVPGPGRLAATAQAWGGRIFVFGGYTVDSTGAEASLPNLDVFDPASDRWLAGAPIPVPVDDAVSGVWNDSLIVLVSGWHNNGNVANVQIYNPARDAWHTGESIPGPRVFGHTGGTYGNVMVYVDGAEVGEGSPRYTLAASSWLGVLDPERSGEIEWSALPPHPGPPLYRAAAVGVPEGVVFYGGTDNPYNYTGMGYDGEPASARAAGFLFRSNDRSWRALPDLPVPSMDHRGLVVIGDRLVVVGGMDSSRAVTAAVWQASLAEVLAPALTGDTVPDR